MTSTPPRREGTQERLVGLDVIRGIAVAVVVAFHLFPDAVPGGFLGVTSFFVLSGFLISRQLVTIFERHGVGGHGVGGHGVGGHGGGGAPARWRAIAKDFYGRRVRRLVPAISVTLLVVAVWGVVAAPWATRRLLRGDLFAAATWWSNWRQLSTGADYFGGFRRDPLVHFWSLAIEEQFYVVFPLVLVAVLWVARRRLDVAAAICGGAAAVAWAWQARLASSTGSTARLGAYLRTDARAGELLIGVALGLWTVSDSGRRTLTRLHPVATSMFVGGALGVIALTVIASQSRSWLTPWAFVACSALTVVAICGVMVSPLSTRAPSWAQRAASPLARLGELSFAVYLFHVPLAVILAGHLSGAAHALVVIVATLVTAVASERWVEMPVRRGEVQLFRAVPLRAGAAVVGCVCLVALLVPFMSWGPAHLRTAPVGAALTGGRTPVVQVISVGETTLGDRAAGATKDVTVAPSLRVDCRNGACGPSLGTALATASKRSPALTLVDLSALPLSLDAARPYWPDTIGPSNGPNGAGVLEAYGRNHRTLLVVDARAVDFANIYADWVDGKPPPFDATRREWMAMWSHAVAALPTADVSYAPLNEQQHLVETTLKRQLADVPLLVTYGDSTARDVGASLDQWLALPQQWRTLAMGWFGCGVHDLATRRAASCREVAAAMAALQPPKGSIVVVSAGFADATSLSRGTTPAELEKQYRALRDALRAKGLRIRWVNTACSAQNRDGTKGPNQIDPANAATINRIIAGLGVPVIDADRVLCRPAPTSPSPLDIRPDGVHLSAAGAQWFIARVGPEILATRPGE